MPVAAPAVDAATDVRDQSAMPRGRGRWRRTQPRAPRQRPFADPLWRVLGGSYHESLFERPDLIEDDYYRLRRQPRD